MRPAPTFCPASGAAEHDTASLLLIGEPLRTTLYREALRELRGDGGQEPEILDLNAAIVAGQEVLLPPAPRASGH